MKWHQGTRLQGLLQSADFREHVASSMVNGRVGVPVQVSFDDGSSGFADVAACSIGILRIALSDIDRDMVLLEVWASFTESLSGVNPDGSEFHRARVGKVSGRVTIEIAYLNEEARAAGEAGIADMNVLTTLSWKAEA